MTPIRVARYCLALLVLVAAGWILSGGLSAQGPGGQRLRDRFNGHEAVSGEVIVKYRTVKNAAERAQINAIIDAEKDDEIGDSSGRLRHIKSRRFDAATLVA